MGATTSVRATKDGIRMTHTSKRDLQEAIAHGAGIRDFSIWVELSVHCRNLLNRDITSLSDPFAVLYQKMEDGWKEVGRTEIIPNNLNPEFIDSFQILYEFERVQYFKVEVYDADENKASRELELSNQDFLGEAEFMLSNLVISSDGKLQLQLLGKQNKPIGSSKILLYYEEQTSQSDEVELVLGSTLPKQKPSQLFLRISKQRNDGTWIPTYCSEVKMPQDEAQWSWDPIQMTLRQICNAQKDRHLLFEILLYKPNGRHLELGHKVLTLTEIGNRVDDAVPLDSKKGDRSPGNLEIDSMEINPSPSFLEYVKSGFEICFLVAIDFTKSNGMADYPGSLHHIQGDHEDPDRPLNIYEEAILGVGTVLEAYDTDKKFPTWGFGAKVTPESNVVSHCFALNNNDNAPECDGIRGVLEAYREALERVQLAGPTFFSPVIRAAASLANRADDSKYYCLLMITDGTLMDMTTAKKEIIRASTLPLSIMIVGVGTEDFSKMVELDSDESLLSEGGINAERDIVQFVEFDKYKNNGADLARELLAEFPGQFLSFMRKNEILPLDPGTTGKEDEGTLHEAAASNTSEKSKTATAPEAETPQVEENPNDVTEQANEEMKNTEQEIDVTAHDSTLSD